MTKDIFAPTVGETIQIGQQVNSFSISISDEMLKSLRMSRVGLPSVCAATSSIPTLIPSSKTMRLPTSAAGWSLTPTQRYLSSNRRKSAHPPWRPYLHAKPLSNNGNWVPDPKSHSHIQL